MTSRRSAWVTGRKVQRRRPSGRYGHAHRLERQAWAPKVKAGTVSCGICGYLIVPGTPWHLDHLLPISLGGSSGPRHPAHARCNISKGGRNRLRRSA